MAQFVLSTVNAVYLLLIIKLALCNDDNCDFRPLGARTAPLPPDNRFKLDIQGLGDKYIPMQEYKIQLYATDTKSTFIAFTIYAQGDTKVNEKNPRKPLRLSPGVILPTSDECVPRPRCLNAVIQTDTTPKTAVTAQWRAPPKGNKCVTIHALVAVMQDVWYSFEGPLSKQVCEDSRKAEDMQPPENDDCSVCEDARYMLTFKRLWTYNTHPTMFPKSNLTRYSARFSDVVGASHSKNYCLFKLGSEASQGLKMLAVQGNTTELEIDISKHLGNSVRTIIKATSEANPNMETSSIFRVSREHHFVSLVTAIIPSPDWFLGVAYMELCETLTNKWATNLTLNLYPLDAGTDSGLDFESPNEESLPAQPILSASINLQQPKEDPRPFARIRFNLIRTYKRSDCVTDAPDITKETDKDNNNNSNEPQPTEPPPSRETPAFPYPDSSEKCPMTAWEDWLPCAAKCIDGQRIGYHTRFRYHIVNNVIVKSYDQHVPEDHKETYKYCLDARDDTETKECQETCEEEQEITPESRIWRQSESPGYSWGRK